MPGYIMHLAEGQIILDKLKQMDIDFSVSENEFLLGTILPDAVADKELTHFRPASQKNRITKYPDIPRLFCACKGSRLSACDLGILAHLHMDARYVTDFWPHYFTFLDANHSYTTITADINHVLIYAGDRKMPLKQFFSDAWFYGEYDILNPYIINSVRPPVPKLSFIPEDMQLYDHSRIDPVLLKNIVSAISSNILSGKRAEINPKDFPKIFPEKDTLNFLKESADFFIHDFLQSALQAYNTDNPPAVSHITT